MVLSWRVGGADHLARVTPSPRTLDGWGTPYPGRSGHLARVHDPLARSGH